METTAKRPKASFLDRFISGLHSGTPEDRARLAVSRGKLGLLIHLVDLYNIDISQALDWEGPKPVDYARSPHTKWTLLHVACYCGDFDIAHWLVSLGAPVDVKTSYYISPMHMAAYAGKPEIVSLLAAHGGLVDEGYPSMSHYYEDDPYTPSSVAILKGAGVEFVGNEHLVKIAASQANILAVSTPRPTSPSRSFRRL